MGTDARSPSGGMHRQLAGPAGNRVSDIKMGKPDELVGGAAREQVRCLDDLGLAQPRPPRQIDHDG